MNQKYHCDYSCKHYFGFKTINAKNEKEALIGVKIKIEQGHINTSKKTISDCGNKCKLKIKIR